MTLAVVVACHDGFYIIADTFGSSEEEGFFWRNSQKVFFSDRHKIGMCISDGACLMNNGRDAIDTSFVINAFFRHIDGLGTFSVATLRTVLLDFIRDNFGLGYAHSLIRGVNLFYGGFIGGAPTIYSWDNKGQKLYTYTYSEGGEKDNFFANLDTFKKHVDVKVTSVLSAMPTMTSKLLLTRYVDVLTLEVINEVWKLAHTERPYYIGEYFHMVKIFPGAGHMHVPRFIRCRHDEVKGEYIGQERMPPYIMCASTKEVITKLNSGELVYYSTQTAGPLFVDKRLEFKNAVKTGHKERVSILSELLTDIDYAGLYSEKAELLKDAKDDDMRALLDRTLLTVRSRVIDPTGHGTDLSDSFPSAGPEAQYTVKDMYSATSELAVSTPAATHVHFLEPYMFDGTRIQDATSDTPLASSHASEVIADLSAGRMVAVPLLLTSSAIGRAYGHWIWMVVSQHTDSVDSAAPSVQDIDGIALSVLWLDPEGHAAPQHFISELEQNLPGISLSIVSAGIRTQWFSNNCGPASMPLVRYAISGDAITLHLRSSSITPSTDLALAELPNAADHATSGFANKWYGTYIKHFVHYKELTEFKSMLDSYGIDISVDEGLSPRGFRQIARALHPDRGGSAQDFAFARNLQERWQQDIDLRAIIDSQIQTWQPTLYKATCAFKTMDVTVDAVKFYQVPTLSNAKSVVLGSVHLYSMWNGLTKGFIAANGLTVGYTLYTDGFYPAMQQASTTTLYTVVPVALTAACPPLGFAYTAGMTAYSGYHAASSVYEWWEISDTPAYKLESASAYRDNHKWLYDKTGIEYFEAKAQEYEIEINSIKCNAEKESYKSHLEAKDGQFGISLYKHIYEPYIGAKCALTDKVVLNELGKQDLESLLKGKLVSVETAGYEVCRLDLESNLDLNPSPDDKPASYYCAHRETQSIHHVFINGNAVEVTEIL